jgi:CRP/FNR family cyclic AMP-dependent transcriptional regulator
VALPRTDELLARVPLFSGLSRKGLRELSNLATRLNLPAGHELTRQGALGNEFIIVLDGTVDVTIDGAVINSCGAGDFFGEISLLDNRPRTATVVATSDVVVDVIARPEFSAFLADQPEIAAELRDVMAHRLAEDEALLGEQTGD